MLGVALLLASIARNSHPERISGKDAGMAVRFQTLEGETVLLKVAISYVSVEQARKNMMAELAGWDFDAVKKASFSEWNHYHDDFAKGGILKLVMGAKPNKKWGVD